MDKRIWYFVLAWLLLVVVAVASWIGAILAIPAIILSIIGVRKFSEEEILTAKGTFSRK